ncbi:MULTISPECIES: protocatechuate 3,4-dioxygenase subunit alpha, partial [unclassified Arthrobacter]|uniref:protocatechuate 3,4-dioxygenase subunit alpha n=1 Tax=unclassified Arthrobacter TaxID=235627 RepID=UPI00159CFA5C
MSELVPTPGQTVGPFFAYALPFDRDSELVLPGVAGSVRLHGTVRDGAGEPVPDAMVEIWQPDAQGRVVAESGSRARDGYTFTGWGRAATDRTGAYSFTTVEPGPVSAGAAAFIAVVVFARGLTNRLFTRVYLPGDEAALAGDALLSALPADRRNTLLAVRGPDGALSWDIRLQGENETVFLDFEPTT